MMSQIACAARPDWVSDELFPFISRWHRTSDGHQMHYVDEGVGDSIVFVHGNPAWSFEFRHLIRELRDEYRCIAPDHIGFGLSSRSTRGGDHHPRAHAHRLIELLEKLDVRDATLYLTDWGGPIGLEFARQHPDRVKKIVIANTWCWSVAGDPHFVRFSWFMRSLVGQFMINRLNCFVNKVVPKAIGNKAAITPEMMRHYRNALPNPSARSACAALPGHIIGASDWLEEIWTEREKFVGKPPGVLGVERHRIPQDRVGELAGQLNRLPGTGIRRLRTFPGGGSAGTHAAHAEEFPVSCVTTGGYRTKNAPAI